MAIRTLLFAMIAFAATLPAQAAPGEIPEAREITPDERSKTFGEYRVHFSVFNSAFVPPKVAEAYGITRADNRVLLNLSVTRTRDGNTSLGLPADVSGTATNLIQQIQTLKFQEIEEGEATYYLAPVKHTNEEVYNFDLEVSPRDSEQTFTVEFSRKLYTGEDS